MGDDYTRSFLDFVDAYDEYWEETLNSTTQLDPAKFTDLVIFATSCCTEYFVTNGLWGLLECEWGKMFPEFAIGCRYLGCGNSASCCENLISEFFESGFPRDDSIRRELIIGDFVMDEIARRSELLDQLTLHEKLRDRIESYCRFRCKLLGLQPFKASYTLNLQLDPNWDRKWSTTVSGSTT